jgi:hypothetical protein
MLTARNNRNGGNSTVRGGFPDFTKDYRSQVLETDTIALHRVSLLIQGISTETISCAKLDTL